MLSRKTENELNDGNDDEAVGRRQEKKLGRLPAGNTEGPLHVTLPVLLKQFGVLGGIDMQRDYFRRKPRGKFNPLARDDTPAVDRDDGNGLLTETCRVHGNLAGGQGLYEVIVAADRSE